jgi:hypothetical protein
VYELVLLELFIVSVQVKAIMFKLNGPYWKTLDRVDSLTYYNISKALVNMVYMGKNKFLLIRQ